MFQIYFRDFSGLGMFWSIVETQSHLEHKDEDS